MGLLDSQNTAPEEKNNYSFASGGMDDFLDDYRKPKQDQPIDEAEGLDEIESFEDNETQKSEPLENHKARAAVAISGAKIATIAIDGGASMILSSFVAKDDDPEKYKATKEEREALTDAIAEYIKIKGLGDMPPLLGLLIVILGIYGPKTGVAIQARKFKAKEDVYLKRIKELEENQNPKIDE
jgi:hypothetical protein